tara:strand:- start:229 stop:513 length:285 start_codon:yes stop_codon:yes gene_type:complete
MMKVRNMTSPRGNKVANQFIITDNHNNEIFQSYNTVIAMKNDSGIVYLDKYSWDYSVTTGKYRNEFLGEGIAETRKKINSGEYILTDLNNEGGV